MGSEMCIRDRSMRSIWINTFQSVDSFMCSDLCWSYSVRKNDFIHVRSTNENPGLIKTDQSHDSETKIFFPCVKVSQLCVSFQKGPQDLHLKHKRAKLSDSLALEMGILSVIVPFWGKIWKGDVF